MDFLDGNDSSLNLNFAKRYKDISEDIDAPFNVRSFAAFEALFLSNESSDSDIISAKAKFGWDNDDWCASDLLWNSDVQVIPLDVTLKKRAICEAKCGGKASKDFSDEGRFQ